jgi:hypothetical protein
MTPPAIHPRRATARTARDLLLGLLDRFLTSQALVGGGPSAWYY